MIFATDKAIAASPMRCAASCKGWFETIAFMRSNKAETVEIAKEIMGTDADDGGGIYDELMPMFSDTGKFDPKALAVLQQVIRRDEDVAERARHGQALHRSVSAEMTAGNEPMTTRSGAIPPDCEEDGCAGQACA